MNSTIPPPKVDFSGMVGPKRRRMRSGGNVSTISNNIPKNNDMSSSSSSTNTPLATSMSVMSGMINEDESSAQTSKSTKGSSTIPIFLKSK